MSIQDWPLAERPREKLLLQGSVALSDAELLAVFLRVGSRGKTAVDLARELLVEFDGLRGILSADRRSLCASHGIGDAKYAQLQAVLEMARRHLGQRLRRSNPLTDPAATRDYLAATLRDLPHEVFACLYLDTRHRVIAWEELFRGTLDGTSVHPREVVRHALGHNAAALIFAHNHPSGVAEPSDADRRLTRRLKEALALVDIRVLDHFVVGDGETVSFAERGLL
ncbi:MAG TPA: DNA repair protein RadC [Gammaproteobacteria bacterium]|nr:DNA repair protein RadC [Gammaproteobacteria bacterium]